LGGSLEEQIAALLHDVSHTAFSHVIDYVVDGHDDQSYHEEIKEVYLAQTDIPVTLRKFGYDWHNFLHEGDYPILEQPPPRLCADRVDYFLRDAQSLELATPQEIAFGLDSLVVANGRMALNNQQAAHWFAYTYIQADDASWANFREVGLYEVTARAIKRALETGLISEADFMMTDEAFWQKLQQNQDAELQDWLSLVSLDTQFVWDDAHPTFHVSTKLRAIDPDVVVDGELRPYSSLNPQFASYRNHYLASKQGKWPMRVKRDA
jgi:HD superfamily phosphohydrolase